MNPKTCFECDKFVASEGDVGFCSKKEKGWGISMSLAKQQCLCADSVAEDVALIAVLSPCGGKSFISKVDYEKSLLEVGENFWRLE